MLIQYYLEQYKIGTIFESRNMMGVNYIATGANTNTSLIKYWKNPKQRNINFKNPWEPSEQIESKMFKLKDIITITFD